jgi:hypothetical protein
MIQKDIFKTAILTLLLCLFFASTYSGIPLPEHPRPDFRRADWQNLNGEWFFQFDEQNKGESENWFKKDKVFSDKINVPFSWGAPLSGVADDADIGWYSREIMIPETWRGKRIFIVVGASDWKTRGWLDGVFLGENRGGYTPFEFELTKHVTYGKKQVLTMKVDDTDHTFKLEGKQGYGKARGIWQTIYLEARGNLFVEYVHISPEIEKEEFAVEGALSDQISGRALLKISVKGEHAEESQFDFVLKNNDQSFKHTIGFSNARLWTLEDPYLYDVQVTVEDENGAVDVVNTYFGMRKIDVGNVPGTDFPYVTLNNKPVYLQLTLDQAYHPEGFYTFPSDAFIRDEIIRSKKIGLNGQRIHVKIGIPRKLYWADKLGLLIMADVPNSWGEPDKDMKFETENALKGMIKRDYNHPSIFSWIIFNETWGLMTKGADGRQTYLPETKKWVFDMYKLAKSLDPTRLVEDNSANRRDHVITDLNTWHAYLPGYAWKEFLKEVVDSTYEGSGWNFSKGYVQGIQPMLNSECGNVWGYQGSTGDVDWSWDYHIMVNEFRKLPKIAGWLYTEHHDVINEWNGYYKFDRSEKFTGLESFNGMTLNDLHSMVQITPDMDLMSEVNAGTQIEIPLWLSVSTNNIPYKKAVIKYQLNWINRAGITSVDLPVINQTLDIIPWQYQYIDPIRISLPDQEGILNLNIKMETVAGIPVHKNFVLFRIKMQNDDSERLYTKDGINYNLVSFDPAGFMAAEWSIKQWNILDGKKVNGSGSGFFEYEVSLPKGIPEDKIEGATFNIELSSKQLFGKDRTDSQIMEGDYMRGRGTHDPSRNPNSYPMTDEEMFSSYARIIINGEVIDEVFLPDDPADHRGILSWFSQPKDSKLREAGSYGYLVTSIIPSFLVKEIVEDKKCTVRIEVPDILPGGIAIYGKDFGRYPLNPTFMFQLKE